VAEDKKEEKETVEAEGSQTLYYVVGAVIVIAIAAGAYLLRPKAAPEAPATQNPVTQPVVSTGPITQLACTNQYYNPVVGFPKFYLSTDGVDIGPAKKVDCTFTVSVAGKTVATASATSDITDVPERGGGTFKCTTKALELEKKIPTKVDVEIKDDQGATVGCNRSFSFP